MKWYSKWWMIDLCWVMGMLTLVMFIHETNNGNHWLKQRSMSLKWSMAMITNLPLAFPTNPPCSTKLPLHTNTPPLSTSDLLLCSNNIWWWGCNAWRHRDSFPSFLVKPKAKSCFLAILKALGEWCCRF